MVTKVGVAYAKGQLVKIGIRVGVAKKRVSINTKWRLHQIGWYRK